MFFIGGAGNGSKDLGRRTNQVCPGCGSRLGMQLIRTNGYILLFFVPVFRYDIQYFLICPNCGKKKPEASETWDCACGQTGIATTFCPNCGARKPEPPKAWDCACGQKGIMTNFCPNCGAKRPETPKTWDCACGQKGITTNFCPNCGGRKED